MTDRAPSPAYARFQRNQATDNCSPGGGDGFVCSKSMFHRKSITPNPLQTQETAKIIGSVSANFQKPHFQPSLRVPRERKPTTRQSPSRHSQSNTPGGGLASFAQKQLRPATHSSQIPYGPKRSQKSPVPCQQVLKTSSSAIPARASRGADQPLRKRPTRHPQSNPRGGGSGFVCSKSTPPCNSLIPNLLRTEKIARITPSVSANFQKPGFHRTLSAPQHHPQVSFSSNGIKISSRRTLHA